MTPKLKTTFKRVFSLTLLLLSINNHPLLSSEEIQGESKFRTLLQSSPSEPIDIRWVVENETATIINLEKEALYDLCITTVGSNQVFPCYKSSHYTTEKGNLIFSIPGHLRYPGLRALFKVTSVETGKSISLSILVFAVDPISLPEKMSLKMEVLDLKKNVFLISSKGFNPNEQVTVFHKTPGFPLEAFTAVSEDGTLDMVFEPFHSTFDGPSSTFTIQRSDDSFLQIPLPKGIFRNFDVKS